MKVNFAQIKGHSICQGEIEDKQQKLIFDMYKHSFLKSLGYYMYKTKLKPKYVY